MKLSNYLLLVVSVITYASITQAQQRPEKTLTERSITGIEEVIVTARKRSERLLDTPIAITAISFEELKNRSYSNLKDVAQATPNLDFSAGASDAAGAGFATVFIRGIGQQDYSNATDPGVGIYVDGVYLGRSIGAVLDLADVEQVEVLRGPQGTLFGKNTIGGAINITSRIPKGTDTGSVSLTLGEDDRFDISGWADYGITDNIAVGMAYSHRDQEGFVTRPAVGDEIGEEGSDVIRGKLNVDMGATQVLVSADYTDIDATTQKVYPFMAPNLSPLASLFNAFAPSPFIDSAFDPAFVSPDLRTSNSNGAGSEMFEGSGISLRLEHDFGAVTFRSITAFREFESQIDTDQEGTPAEISRNIYHDEQEQFTQEFNLIGTSMQGKLDWVAGLYYLNEDADAEQDLNLFQGLYETLELLPAAIVPLAPGLVCPAPPPAPCVGGPGNPLNELFDGRIDLDFGTRTQSYAVYGEGSYRFSDQWSVTLGLRFSRDEKDFNVSFTRPKTGLVTIPYTPIKESWDSLTPRLIVNYKPYENIMLYASASRGFKSGGFVSRPATPDDASNPYDPERVWSYEVGYKSELLDNRLRLNAAVFFLDYQDIQLNASGAGFANEIVDNIGEAEIKGFEIDTRFQLTQNLSLQGAIGFTDAEYTQLAPTALGATLDSELPKTPEWTANLGIQLLTPIGDQGSLLWRLDYAYRGKAFNDPANTEFIASDSASLVNARIRWQAASDRWSIALYGKNLLDEEYLLNGFNALSAGGVVLGTPNEPREVGAIFTFNF